MSSDGDQNDPVQRQFEAIHEKLDRLDVAIRGNGKPGILIRLDRLEQDARRQSKLIWLIVGAVVTALASGITGWVAG
ncbi:MAG: hypothetical protein R3C45_21100 [Phycisphaerales bacterium]